jgi:hypothetical protein
MRAIVYDKYGSVDVLELKDIDKPAVKDDEVLVRVRAASTNPLDWHFMRGEPYIVRPQLGLRRPKRRVLGNDMAGVVEAVGKNVARFRPGDEVIGDVNGSYAEYASVSEDLLGLKPANLTKSGRRYDLIFQLAGTRSPSNCRRSPTPKGTLLLSSGESSGRWIGPVGRIIKAVVLSPFVSQRLSAFEAKRSKEYLQLLRESHRGRQGHAGHLRDAGRGGDRDMQLRVRSDEVGADPRARGDGFGLRAHSAPHRKHLGKHHDRLLPPGVLLGAGSPRPGTRPDHRSGRG